MRTCEWWPSLNEHIVGMISHLGCVKEKHPNIGQLTILRLVAFAALMIEETEKKYNYLYFLCRWGIGGHIFCEIMVVNLCHFLKLLLKILSLCILT